jgi:competence protein ComEA
VEARLVFNYGGSVRLVTRKGAQFGIKTAFLSEADREYLRSRRGVRSSTKPTSPEPGKVDINRASFDELTFLPRIGNMLAQRIIDGRPYEHPSDLLKIEGIGMRTYEILRDEVVAGPVKK